MDPKTVWTRAISRSGHQRGAKGLGQVLCIFVLVREAMAERPWVAGYSERSSADIALGIMGLPWVSCNLCKLRYRNPALRRAFSPWHLSVLRISSGCCLGNGAHPPGHVMFWAQAPLYLVRGWSESSCLRCWDKSFFSRDRRIQARARPTSVLISLMFCTCLQETTWRGHEGEEEYTQPEQAPEKYGHLSSNSLTLPVVARLVGFLSAMILLIA